MMQVAIFENEQAQVEGAFNSANMMYFNGELRFKFFVSYQNARPFKELLSYSIIFVDLDLSLKSEKDGYHVIQKLYDICYENNIVIITGMEDVHNEIKKRDWPNIDVIIKPLSFVELEPYLSVAYTAWKKKSY